MPAVRKNIFHIFPTLVVNSKFPIMDSRSRERDLKERRRSLARFANKNREQGFPS